MTCSPIHSGSHTPALESAPTHPPAVKQRIKPFGVLSLVILETIVHCQYIKDLYNRVALSIKVPDTLIDIINEKSLPKDWNSTPWHNYTIDEGSKWLNLFENLMLKLPSAIVPEESIYMVNPRHPEFKKVKVASHEVFNPNKIPYCTGT